MTSSDGPQGRKGVLQSATDMFLGSTRSVVELLAQAGGAGAQALVPDPVLTSVSNMLRSMRKVVDEAPQISAELDVMVSELHAKRLTIQAVTAELGVLDAQLELLEQTLAPVQAWS
ncbi:hypothetical protein, partial [Microbacterium sp.]|uniref:hypothetical protein n=1 Tax=Microbacterium sp. TaxID=51671 RepID=UPI002E2F5D11